MTNAQLASSARRTFSVSYDEQEEFEHAIQHCATWFTPGKRVTSNPRPYDLADDLVIYWHYCAKLGVNG